MNKQSEEFQRILKGAVAGSYADLERIFRIYDPLIREYSTENGKVNEDLRQYILLHIAQKISKFDI